MNQRQKTAIEVLTEGWSQLPKGSHDFAQSLLYQWNSKQFLTPKQWEWAIKLSDVVSSRGVPDFTEEFEKALAWIG